MPVRFAEPIVLLCDRVHREAGTNKAHLQGLFDRVLVLGAWPVGMTGAIFVRFRLTDTGSGTVDVQLRLQRPSGQQDMLPTLKWTYADGKCEGDLRVENMPLLHAGRHQFHLHVEGERLASVSFDVMEISGAKPSAN